MADRSSEENLSGTANGRTTRPPVPDTGSLADLAHTQADSDQTLSDADQTVSDSDQTSAESDQMAADHDQAASDHDLAAGVDPRAYEFSRDIRQRTARERGRTAQARLVAADKRDAVAHARDLMAHARDQAAEVRDLAMAASDGAAAQEDVARALTGADVVIRAAALRGRAARQRARAAQQRVLAAADRAAAAADRVQAADERERAHADREAIARELAVAETDALTGVRTRAAGLIDLEHEIDRCRRGDGRLVVAYVDVVGLKAVNDRDGHTAGDTMLLRVVHAIRGHLRTYDLMLRLGGDEFLCAMSSMPLADAHERFETIAAALARASPPAAITTGFAELESDDSIRELIARADRELIDNRRADADTRPQAAADPSA